MAIKFDKNSSKIKGHASTFNKVSITFFVFEIISLVGVFTMLLSPYLGPIFGLIAFLFFSAACIITCCVTLFIPLFYDGFRNFWGNGYSLIFKMIGSSDVIKNGLKSVCLPISILVIVLSLIAIITSLAHYKRSRENKGRFIASSIIAAISTILAIVCMVLYL